MTRKPIANLNLIASVTEVCRENEYLAEILEETRTRVLSLEAEKMVAERGRDEAIVKAAEAEKERDETRDLLREAMNRRGGGERPAAVAPGGSAGDPRRRARSP